jgi:hypothetical protein
MITFPIHIRSNFVSNKVLAAPVVGGDGKLENNWDEVGRPTSTLEHEEPRHGRRPESLVGLAAIRSLAVASSDRPLQPQIAPSRCLGRGSATTASSR